MPLHLRASSLIFVDFVVFLPFDLTIYDPLFINILKPMLPFYYLNASIFIKVTL
jgi:hypothetical protein